MQRYVRDVPNVAWDLLALTNKPTTVILDDATNLAQNLIADDGSSHYALQMSHFRTSCVIDSKEALVSTSANISGEPSAANFCDISQEIIDAVDYVCWSRQQRTQATYT